MEYKEFIFESYHYDPAVSTLSLRYRFSEGPCFQETLAFDFAARELSATESQVLDRIFRLVFLTSGVSYYKAYIPKTIICEAFALDEITAEFLHDFYEKGLAAFAFRNGISLNNHFRIQSTTVRAVAP